MHQQLPAAVDQAFFAHQWLDKCATAPTTIPSHFHHLLPYLILEALAVEALWPSTALVQPEVLVVMLEALPSSWVDA